MFAIKSSLGNFLRKDAENFVPDTANAKRFATQQGAYDFITESWGSHNHRYFFVVTVREKKENRASQDL